MKFSFQNLGIIAKADIELKGLTVITGLNDTGKSFIGKAIFSIVKTISDSGRQELNNRLANLDQLISTMNIQVRQFGLPKVEQSIGSLRNEIFTGLIQKVPTRGIIDSTKAKKLEILRLVDENISASPSVIRPPQLKNIIETTFNNVERVLASEISNEDKLRNYFDNVIIQDLFKNQINNLSNHQEVQIRCEEGTQLSFSMTIQNNKVFTLTANDLQNNFGFQDATLIESPIILQLTNLVVQFSLASQGKLLPLHFIDLVRKLLVPNLSTNESISVIQEIIKGRAVYDENKRNIVFQKSDGITIEPMNIATGIKSFGIIQLLLNSNSINQKSILIIDEPEVHLHPKWEVEYAKLIVNLAKVGIPIIVSSHSAYFLKAISKFVNEREIQSITKFYYGEKNDSNSSTFRDVTSNLEPIYHALAKPMEELF